MDKKKNQKILVVDDEQSITDFVSFNLEKNGYIVDVCDDGQVAIAMIEKFDYDLIILDIMLPSVDGYEICKQVRKKSDVPILFLSARDTEIDKVVGLELGGDDYLSKPFGIHELLARVHALLRRQAQNSFGSDDGSTILKVGDFVVNRDTHFLEHKGKQVELTQREFELLLQFMLNPNKVLSRDDILEKAWGWDNKVKTNTVDTHIKRLRDKFIKVGIPEKTVESVRGYGYRLVEPKTGKSNASKKGKNTKGSKTK
ncbi:MAG: response regulator transcription factor [Coriobacteriales bacterium]|nr:response regulator transcription factor [Coriobacteriales bacterium]